MPKAILQTTLLKLAPEAAIENPEAEHLADLAYYDRVLAGCAANPGADAGIIALVTRSMAKYRESDALSDLAFWQGDEPENLRARAKCRKITNLTWDMMAKLAGVQATSLPGYKAKAIIVRFINNCSVGQATGYEDDCMAWSLAGDLLGLASPLKLEDAA